MAKTEQKMGKEYRAILTVFTVVFAIYAFSLLFPFLWLIFNSFKGKHDFLENPMSLSGPFSLGNYLTVFQDENFRIFEMYFHSITLVLGQTFVSLFVVTCTAYVVAKYSFFGRNFVYALSTVVLLVPTQGSLITLFEFMNNTHLMNNYLGMIIMSAGGFGFNFFILYGFFKNVSSSYAEAAEIDGAGHFTIFMKVMIPQCIPVLISLAIIGGIGVWNDYYTQLVFYSDYPTIAVGIQTLSEDIVEMGLDYPAFFAAIVLTTLPVIIIYAVFQKTIVNNTAVGGLKG